MSRVSRARHRDGWTLRAERPYDPACGSLARPGTPMIMMMAGPVRYYLDDLAVTQDEAMALMERHPWGTTIAPSLTWTGLLIGGIELTEAEATAIAGGRGPLEVLLPGALRVRLLTAGELLA